ncbi:uncharacterized protein LOC111892310 isoform X1 [Lactuca sativa]|uniref:Uncharacterized protein n=1 Tax=Lactuca sativa TaxID=4236 RepID=A0A9R1VY37_LACSA|nr:uncharacterized protein LOC111892310 isoform X1 [Lactuca sativa]KAJ0213057.1 hypothetical protein LSAT_V11C400191520 [Lactuca sativa]
MAEDDWVAAAMEDSDLVAEVLVRLRVAKPPPSLQPSKRRRPSPPQSWTIHQRRSRSQPVVLLPAPNKSEAPRASPSTPLCWSGATSVSGGGGGGGVPIVDAVDSSTQPNHNRSDISRSKVMPRGETTPTKRPRKKKTLAALKEEEVLLMEEQTHLKMKLATLHANCEKQRKENQNLKKMKLDIQGERLNAFRCGGIQQPNNHFEEQKDKIVLPDLNVAVGEDVIVSY